MTMKPMTPMTMAMSFMLAFRKRKGKICCKTVKSYQDCHRLNVLDCSLLSRQFNLERSLLPGVPLTEAQALEAECIDDLRTKSMLKAESKCRHLFTGGVCFSLKVAEPLAVLIFWELVISPRKGVDVSSRRIK